MTAVPRVRVTIRRWKGKPMATVKCPQCSRFQALGRVSVDHAQALATDHAATCAALRLAALLARLEALRDEMRGRSTWPKKSQYWVGLTDAFEVAADDLDTLIAEARR